MAQAANQNLTSDAIRKVKHGKAKTTSLAITETQEYDLETQAEEEPALEYRAADVPLEVVEEKPLRFC